MVKGRGFSTETNGTLDGGRWTVEVVIKERVTENGVDWVEQKIDASVIDVDYDRAHKTALRILLSWLDENVYAKGFTSLIDAMDALEKEQQLADGRGSSGNTTLLS